MYDKFLISPNLFDGRFDGIIIFMLVPFMIIGGVGTCAAALWCLFRCLQGMFSRTPSRMAC